MLCLMLCLTRGHKFQTSKKNINEFMLFYLLLMLWAAILISLAELNSSFIYLNTEFLTVFLEIKQK